MLKFRRKLLMLFLIGIIASVAIMPTALAGVSISGSSQVYPGRTYTYTITVTETGSSIMGTAKTSGVLGSQTKTWAKDSSTGLNQSLKATTSITVTIPSSAAIGSTGTITVSGQGSSYDAGTGTVSKFNISGSKTITVVAPPTPPPPTAWELAIRDINRVEEGGSFTVEMNPEDAKEINVPVEVFQAIKDRSVVLSIDYGSFVCIVDGSTVGEVPSGGEDINIGITLKPATRADDMLVFDLNNTAAFFYVAIYQLEPFLALPDGLIYVYRNYENINILEYVNAAGTDENGNVQVKVYVPGNYIVSSASIDGSEGNMDEKTFIELFATPIPSPSPTPSPTPTIEPTPEPETGMEISPVTWLLLALLAIMVAALFITVIMGRSKVKH